MADGNKRYLGDVFINEENAEYQRQFFRDIIESYQYKYGGDFDASTLRGMLPDDFATKEQGEKADTALQSPLLIGERASLTSSIDPQYIYTDGVMLDRENECFEGKDWYEQRSGVKDNLSTALCSIHTNVKAMESEIRSDLATVKRIFKNCVDINGREVTMLDSDLINGLRFILITQEQYDAYKNSSDENEVNYINDWRNIFIIKDANDIPNSYESPLCYKFEDGYDFRIDNSNLQYKLKMKEDGWTTICSLDDLLDGSDFTTKIQNVVNGNYLLSTLQSVNDQASNIENEYESYPFLSSHMHNQFVYKIFVNNSASYITESITNGLKKVNIDLETLLSRSSKINAITSAINNLSSRITNLTSKYNNLQEDFNRLKNNYDSWTTTINWLNNGIGKISESTSFNSIYTDNFVNKGCIIYYNNFTKTAFIHLEFEYNYNSSNKGIWVKFGGGNDGARFLPTGLLPKNGFKLSHNPFATVYISKEGQMWIKNTDPEYSGQFRIHVGGTYIYRGLTG